MKTPLYKISFTIVLLFLFGCSTMSNQMTSSTESRGEIGNVYTGIDVEIQKNFSDLVGKRIGLITNQTGLSRDGISTIDVLFNSKNCVLGALFSPEHGIRGVEDNPVNSSVDSTTGLPINSLYGRTTKPTPDMLKNVDVLVFDIQDIGTRFYTYIGTMALAMKAAKENNKKFIVLDRPNPIGGIKVEGAVPPKELTGKFTSMYPIPTRHGMTVGELALMFNDYFGIHCDLEVIPMKNWQRWMYYDQTGLLWTNPSPNMKTLNGAILYPGPGIAETTNVSCGRGMDRPFEMYGAPFMDGKKVADNLNKRHVPGVRFVPFSFLPTVHVFHGQECHGVFVIIADRSKVDSLTIGLHLMQAFYDCYPTEYKDDRGFAMQSGDPNLWKSLTQDHLSPEQIIAKWQPDIDKFMKVREKYLLY